MNDLPKKQLFDCNGTLIKENDIVKISKTRAGDSAILVTAKYDEKNQRWLFYNDVVPYTWEELQMSQVKSIIVVSNNKKQK